MIAENNGRVRARNKIAAGSVAREGISVDDPYGLVKDHPEYWSADGVHFNAQRVAAAKRTLVFREIMGRVEVRKRELGNRGDAPACLVCPVPCDCPPSDIDSPGHSTTMLRFFRAPQTRAEVPRGGRLARSGHPPGWGNGAVVEPF